jgi:multidrug efflux pump subunit AcrA (membrane-fusion protein)
MDDVPLAIGMTTETNIVVEERQNALLVPSNALVDGKVWILKGGRVQARSVVVGVAGPERTELRGGLADDETIVVQPPEKLKEGARIRAVKAARTAPNSGPARVASQP